MNFPLNVVVASAVRTPVGRGVKGSLKDTRPDDLAALVLRAALEKVPNLAAEQVDDVVLGCAMPEAEQGLNLARNALFIARLPNTTSAQTINRFCSSGLQAIVHGGLAIAAGLQQVVLAGGVESMSMVPMSGNKVSLNPELMDRYPEAYIAMGHTAERVAKQTGYPVINVTVTDPTAAGYVKSRRQGRSARARRHRRYRCAAAQDRPRRSAPSRARRHRTAGS